MNSHLKRFSIGNAGADNFVLKLVGRMCIRYFYSEDGDTLLIPSDNYYFARKKGCLVLYCEDTVVAKSNGGSDDFCLPLINHGRYS
tara:strand:+ start:359 stop:616 length:258 start_codon:yes stop_codon:yes gene_type:complete